MSTTLVEPKPTEKSLPHEHWHAMEPEFATGHLGTNVNRGLSAEEAKLRRNQYGPNEIRSQAETRWYEVLGRQFIDVLILILLIAAGISVVVGELTDAITILAIVILNGLLGFIQEWKAERALAALKEMLSPQCRVIRDGDEQQIDAVELVPGDAVLLATGDRVPADLRLVDVLSLKVDESALTGESLSVSKQTAAVDSSAQLAERPSMAWAGTAVTNGRALGIAVATGSDTEFGRIAQLTQDIGTETTTLQRELGGLGKQLGVFAIGISLLVGVTGWWMGKEIVEMVMTGISLAVAVVPEGLPAVVTLTMALGIREMVRRKALLRRLQAAEGLGAATVICTDKTGTLTQNQMTVQTIWTPSESYDVTGVGYDPAGHFEVSGEKTDYRQQSDLMELLTSALACNHASLAKDSTGWHESGEPTESALVTAAYKAWLEPAKGVKPVAEFPFNSSRKRMTVVMRDGDFFTAHSKGAPEVLLPRCTTWFADGQQLTMTDEDRTAITEAYTEMAEQGLRTLIVARRELPANAALDEGSVENELTLLGVVGMTDPPRPEAAEAVQLAQAAGIRVLMITGDSAPTALAIARRVGIPAETALTGQELGELSNEQLSEALQGDVVFARTTPEHKLRIVTLLQSQGHVVGMTGDGVNDAPALKKADVGIAMGIRGTEVAKGAADMVLTDDNFSSIVGAIEEGRRQYDNIQKFVRYLLSSNTGEIVAIFLNIVLGGPLILLPVQILWMNLVTDGLTAVALGLEPAESALMQAKPRDPRQPILDRKGMLIIAALGTYIGVATLALFHYYLQSNDPNQVALAGTVAFTGIILIEKMNVLNFRSLRSPLTSIGLFTNPWILVAIAGTIGLQVMAVYLPPLQRALHTVPLGWSDWGLMLAVAAPILIVPQAYRLVVGKGLKKSHGL
ncbi:cation-translocating P-type ATPase [Adhaeretor mobilis]|uniref:Calcium-transporting ATPase n=1 Tax=Adhaeretor mobilis TaxID=1930276 RepID=A0A517MZD0_9BACT|nr:cation-transporting P-type ATPase [Adhaeretor mobilis]QDT00233.1 Calcium-transporting ATPase [Adhaeretor mobilis]